MSGLEAFVALLNRKNIRRKCWDSGHLVKWTVLNENQMSMEIIKDEYSLTDNMHRSANRFADLLKDLLEPTFDWEIVE